MMLKLNRAAVIAAAVVAGVVAVSGQSARATLLVNEQFLTGSNLANGEYNTSLRLNNASSVPTVPGMASTGWVNGFTDANTSITSQTHVVADSLSVPGVGYAAGGKVKFDASPVDTSIRVNSRIVSTPYAGTSPLYLSAIASTEAFPATAGNAGQRGYAVMGMDNVVGPSAASGTLAGYYLGFRANADDTIDLILRHRNGTNSTSNPLADIVLLTGATPGTNYLFLIRADINVIGGNQEMVHWWVNPTDVTSEATATSTALATGTFNDYSFQNATSEISRLTLATYRWDANAYFDEFRMGTTFADVAGAPVSVPEPAAIGLIAAPALLGLRRRSR